MGSEADSEAGRGETFTCTCGSAEAEVLWRNCSPIGPWLFGQETTAWERVIISRIGETTLFDPKGNPTCLGRRIRSFLVTQVGTILKSFSSLRSHRATCCGTSISALYTE